MKYFLNQINNIPALPGIYKFYSLKDELLYVGKAKNLIKRVSSYFVNSQNDPKKELMVSRIAHVEIITVSSEFEALLLEAKLIKDSQPKYNVVWRDDKHFIYIKITKEKFPKILFARKTERSGEFFGPFPSSSIVKEILKYIRTIFPYCTQKESSKRTCFYHHLGLCDPCPSEITKLDGIKYELHRHDYLQNINSIRNILRGNINSIKKLLVADMNAFSSQKKYEKAAVYRDKVNQLDYLVNHYNPIESYLENPHLLGYIRNKERQQLEIMLSPYYPKIGNVRHIECYDISNISGKLATGSMVTFRLGEPVKNLYRRFRIISKVTADDFAMLAEMMSRRINHQEWQLPDLFVIDGGTPQLTALRKILGILKISTPIIGLAKAFEEIVVPLKDSYVKIRLPASSSALNLLKRLRDEAHRFAHTYHTQLRLKYLFK